MTIVKLLRVLGLGWLTWALTPDWLMRDAAFALAVTVAMFVVVAMLLVRGRTRNVVRCSSDGAGALPAETTAPVPGALGWSR